VIVKGLGGTVVVELPGRVDADAWLPRWRAIRVPAPQRAMTRTRPITKPGTRHRRPSSAALCACLGPYRLSTLGHTFDPRSILDRVLRAPYAGYMGFEGSPSCLAGSMTSSAGARRRSLPEVPEGDGHPSPLAGVRCVGGGS